MVSVICFSSLQSLASSFFVNIWAYLDKVLLLNVKACTFFNTVNGLQLILDDRIGSSNNVIKRPKPKFSLPFLFLKRKCCIHPLLKKRGLLFFFFFDFFFPADTLATVILISTTMSWCWPHEIHVHVMY